jgi:EF hand domain-containing protein
MGKRHKADRRSLATALCLTAALAACATHRGGRHWNPNGDPSEWRNRANWHSPAAALLRYDANHDGTVTRAEMEAGLKADFDRIDVKRTGCLDGDEVAAENARRQAEDAATYSPMIDWQQKGCIDFNAFAAPTRSLFEELDKNADGKLTPDEINPHQPKKSGSEGQQGHRHHRGGGEPGGGEAN